MAGITSCTTTSSLSVETIASEEMNEKGMNEESEAGIDSSDEGSN